MKKSTVTISYDEEKLNALRLFLTQKDLDLDEEMSGVLDGLFKKIVPADVRRFLELKNGEEPKKKPAAAKKKKAGPFDTFE